MKGGKGEAGEGYTKINLILLFRYYRRRVGPKVDVRLVLAVTISLISAAQGNQIFIRLNYLNFFFKLNIFVIKKVGRILFQSHMFFFLVPAIIFKCYENDDFLLISIISPGRTIMKQSNVWPQFQNTEFRWIIIQNNNF